MRSTNDTLDYIGALYAPECPLLREITATFAAREFAWQMGPEECKLVQMLIMLHRTKTIVEIGTLGGYSAIWMARALPPDGHVTTLERNPEHVALARDFITRSDVAGNITVLEGDGHALLDSLSQRAQHDPFDMMLIDGDKPGYNAYLDWAEIHVRTGGLIIADNTLLAGSIPGDTPPQRPGKSTWEGMKRFNERLADSSKFESVIVPTAEGLSVAIKR